MLIHYLVKDEPQAGALPERPLQQSGRAKLAALAFPLPLAQAGRSGGKLVLWGQVRPRAGAQTYRVQVRTAAGAGPGGRRRGAGSQHAVAAPKGTLGASSRRRTRLQRSSCPLAERG